MQKSVIVGFAGILLLLQACADPFAYDERRVLAVIRMSSEANHEVVAAPDTVSAGSPFVVTITSFGGGCIREGGAEVSAVPGGVEISVYDYTPAPGESVVCPAVLRRLSRTVTLTIDEPGAARLYIRGRNTGPSLADGDTVIVERPLVVQ